GGTAFKHLPGNAPMSSCKELFRTYHKPLPSAHARKRCLQHDNTGFKTIPKFKQKLDKNI
ncbi:MAG: hypothetical protein DWQ10_06350, partial [Calditrichaeota bacterium]